jgi:protein O-GlcNAc transferase
MPKPPIRKPQSLDLRKTLQDAVSLHRQGKLKDAERLYQAVLKLRPDHFDALHLLGVLRAQQGSPQEAVKLISHALERQPHAAEAHSNFGSALAALNRHEEAIASYDKALAIKPAHTDALYNRGSALAQLNRHEEAIASYDKALAIQPNASAFYNRGNALKALNRHEEAIASYDQALAIKPDHVDALYNRGNALQALNRHEQALASYDKALAIKPDHADALTNRGNALQALNRHEEALASYDKALTLKPDYKYAFGDAAHCRAHICDWRNRNLMEQELVDDVRSGRPVVTPFAFLAMSENPADQRSCAHVFVRDRFPGNAPSRRDRVRYEHDRIRVAYLSADFHDHATAYLIAGLLEQHDRARFQTTGISFGPDSRGDMRSRLARSLDRFTDVRGKSDAEVARLIRESEIDVAVDLMGFTTNCRPGILARRPAPIQVSYLGYPGTIGAGFIDYIIADEFVIPRDHEMHYSEKIAYLPDCYQVNDSKRRIGERTPTRVEVGLPERGFVFCCFNNSYKITPQIFDIWMRLLQRVEGSVLWLYQRSPVTVANLRREAQARGIDPGRLVFASRVRLEEHLSRHRLADLFLDTLPYNAHTTASDALWAGLPVLTCAGTTFAGRVAGSLLHAVELPELVTNTLEDYEVLALRLATDESLLRKLKEKLARNRLSAPLFNAGRFRRHIEAAYTTMWEIHQRGEEPRTFAVMPLD